MGRARTGEAAGVRAAAERVKGTSGRGGEAAGVECRDSPLDLHPALEESFCVEVVVAALIIMMKMLFMTTTTKRG